MAEESKQGGNINIFALLFPGHGFIAVNDVETQEALLRRRDGRGYGNHFADVGTKRGGMLLGSRRSLELISEFIHTCNYTSRK